jgi:hypothetical protein
MNRTQQSPVASRVVLSYRAVDADEGEWELADSDWIRDRMNVDYYLQYIKRVHGGPVAVGEEFEEFVNCGCASPQDVIVRVEAVEGGEELGADTDLEVVPRRDVLEEA